MKRLSALVLTVAAFAAPAWAQSYPDKSRPFKMIVPFGTGAAADQLARALGRGMTEVAGITVVIDNRPGAESVIGVQAAKHAPTDGYTLLFTNSGSQVLNVHMLPQLPYDPIADFTPLVGIAKFSLVMSAGPSQPFRTVRELVDAAKATPGKYTYGSATPVTRVAMETFEHLAGVKLLSVPYKAMSEATTALAGGQVDLLINDAGIVIPQYKAGRLRPLATTGAVRMAALPQVPTLRESGLATYEVTGWFATYFPAATPSALAAPMREIIAKALKTKHVTDMLERLSFEHLDASGDRLTELQRSDSAKWGTLVRQNSASHR